MHRTRSMLLSQPAAVQPPGTTQLLSGSSSGAGVSVAYAEPAVSANLKYELATRGATLDVVGVPSAGGVGVTVALVSVKDLQAQVHHRLPRDPLSWLVRSWERPRDQATRASSPRPGVHAWQA
jgi:hypothetical protein